MNTDTPPVLAAHSRGFRERYLSYAELTEQVHAWAEAFPGIVRVQSIGQSLEGRELWTLTVGPEPERTRPSVWIDGNMHASELCGSSVALALAEEAIALHLSPEETRYELPAQVRETLRGVLFYITPRICPDGAEAVLSTGQYVRSNPRDRRPERPARWVSRDIDGDGQALLMRVQDPAGEFVESSELPGLLLPRRIEDEGPFYKVYPEGVIEAFDGHTIPDPYFLSDNDTDLNRNFPWSWMPEPEQAGAGAYPMSEPESRAVVEFTSARPEIFAWLNLHTFGGVYIRPRGDVPDKKMDPGDLALFRQIEEWGEQYGGYPTVSGFEEFLYAPDKPLHGDMADYGYHQRGALAYVCELWDIFQQIGLPRRKPFIDNYSHLKRDDLIALGRWDQEHNQSRVLRPWVRVTHPQLGEVEVGGVDPRVGIVNPPYERLAEVCGRQSATFLRVAAMAPQLSITRVVHERLGEEAARLWVTVENRGYLPTYILESARARPWNEPPRLEVLPEGGASLGAPEDARRELGHLQGWGRGLFHGSFALYHQRSAGSVSSKTVSLIVKGQGSVLLRVVSARGGVVERRVELGGQI